VHPLRWRPKYGGMEVSDAKKLRALEDENRRLKTLVADLTLDNQMLKAVVQRKWESPWLPRTAARARGRESAAEDAGRRSHAGQSDAQGRRAAKVVTPMARRHVVGFVRDG